MPDTILDTRCRVANKTVFAHKFIISWVEIDKDINPKQSNRQTKKQSSDNTYLSKPQDNMSVLGSRGKLIALEKREGNLTLGVNT